jgi:hypothetical protein
VRRPFFGAGIGAIVGLIIATIWNQNCNSVADAASGCTRFDPGGTLLIGAMIGLVAGTIYMLARRRK